MMRRERILHIGVGLFSNYTRGGNRLVKDFELAILAVHFFANQLQLLLDQ